jgi:hypothetical protein
MSVTVRFDQAAVGLDECFGDRQLDTGSAVLAIASGVGPIEAIEQPVQVFGGHTGAGI